MQKNSITNKITPCCGLPFSVIYWWVSNLTLNSESDRQYLLTQISQSGVLSIDGWKVLINSGTLEADASFDKPTLLSWFDCGKQPSKEQLKIIIEGFEVGGWTPEGIQKITNNFYELNSEQIVPTDALYENDTLAGDIMKRVQLNVGIDVNYKKTDKWEDGSTMTDAKVDGFIYRKKNGEYWKKTSVDGISVMDFNAKGDGVADDWGAVVNSVEFCKLTKRALYFPDGFVFNLDGKSVDFSGVNMNFKGGILKNGKVGGVHIKITADKRQIFDNIELTGGYFYSATGVAHLEWFGLKQNDPSYDISDYYPLLAGKFAVVELGDGLYFARKGEIQVKGTLKGASNVAVAIEYHPEKDNTYLFCLGVLNGDVHSRDYSQPTIEGLTIATSATSRRKGLSAIIVGASSEPVIRDLRIRQNDPNLVMTETDLNDFVSTRNPAIANIGIEFRGDSELINLTNIWIYSDIAVKISNFIDFVLFSDCTLCANLNGISCLYYTASAVDSQNISLIGSISMNQGLYGIYVEDSTGWQVLLNNKFDGVRIEQLNGNILNSENKVEASSIRIGSSNRLANPSFTNIVCAGTGSAFFIGQTRIGGATFKNITLTREYSVDVPHPFRVEFMDDPQNTFRVLLEAFEASTYGTNAGDKKPSFYNGRMINKSINPNNFKFDEAVIVYDPPKGAEVESEVLMKNEFNGVKDLIQRVKIESNNVNYIKLVGVSDLKSAKIDAVRYKIEVYIMERISIVEFVLYKDFYAEILNQNQYIYVGLNLSNTQFNIIINDTDKTVFLFNRLGGNSFVNITAQSIKMQ